MISVHASTTMIRLAAMDDLPGIVALVNEGVRRGDLLPRSPESIARTLDDWLVAVKDGEVLGCVSLLAYSPGLAEVRSLAVQSRYRSNGVGSKLLATLIDEARQRQVGTLFALTRVVPFFQRAGFTVADRAMFPEKVWRDCQQCPLQHHCDETAVVLILE